MRRTEWWQIPFGTPNGDLSVARLQIACGISILVIHSFIAFLRVLAQVDAPPFSIFIIGPVVLLTGGVAVALEARIERLPDLTSWLGPLAPESSTALNVATARALYYWLDIAVLQLGLGAVVIPILSFIPALDAVGWRLVTITIVSELVYLAFLSAQLVQKDELDALFAAIRKTKKRIALAAVGCRRPAGGPSAVPETEDEKLKLQAEEKRKLQAEEAKQAEEEKLELLQDRARILMRRIVRTFATVKQSA